MIGATMPKTPVDENDQTERPPHDVGLAPVVGLGPGIDAVTDATRVEKLPDQ
jgi:hypothetical protein